MAGETKVLQFSEGVSVTAPAQTFLSASSFVEAADIATFVANKGSAAVRPDCFYNTTENVLYIYDGADWQVYKPEIKYANESIAGAASISSNNFIELQNRPVQGDGGAQVAANKLFGSGALWRDGIRVLLTGLDNTNTLTINNADEQYGVILNGQCVLGLYSKLCLEYDSTAERWVEVYRNF